MTATGEPGPAGAEADVRRLWSARGLPPSGETLGRGTGPVLHQFLGSYTPGDAPVLILQRAVAADVDARATILGGGRVFGTLRREGWSAAEDDPVVAPLLRALAVWTGGPDGRGYDRDERFDGVQRLAVRLAQAGVLVVREGPVRLCPSCAAPRSPERTIYHEEVGDTFLVRFPLEAGPEAPAVEALAWVDAPWRLLGATALLVSPDLPYVTVEYKRGDVHARLLTLRSSLDRLRAWLPGTELNVVDEQPGRAYAGRRYQYPLRHEFPDGASLVAPSGTVQAVPEVGDSGTGVVPLVPGHGGTDALIAKRLGILGWPLLTARGTLDLTLMHKYAGLDLETASEFVARDLGEAGSVLARLRVLRGVPYCGVCGRPVVWFPGRCWCLEPTRLPPEQAARYAELLPHDRPLAQIEVTLWPASETRTDDSAAAVTLLECDRCSRLDAPGAPAACSCGGRRRPVGRRLVPSIAGALAAWALHDPVPPGDLVRFYLGERRRAPTIVHLLTAMSAVTAAPAEVRATMLPTVSDVDLVGLVRDLGADAVRSAFVRTDASDRPGGSFAERCRQEHRRLSRLVELATELAATGDRPGAAGLAVPAGPTDRELQPEDRALLARWAETEVRVLAAYDELRPAEAHRRLTRFAEVDLARYREIVRPRLAPEAPVASRRAAQRTVATGLVRIATALAPIAPFTAETVARTLRPDSRSLFETDPFDVDEAPADEALAEAWDRWRAVVRAAERFRVDHHLPPGTPIPSAALVVVDDELGDRLRGDRAVLERLAGIVRVEVGSPRSPWDGRRRTLVPVESEVQKAYPALSAQIIHLLRRMPPRRPEDAPGAQGFALFVQGQPQQITPNMLAVVESLPERVVPTPFALGEMYAEVPAGGSGGGLALSADAAWLVRRVAHRLRAVGPDAARALSVRIVAVDPLAKELRERWAALAAALGVASLTIDTPAEHDGGPASVTGRTRLGARWSVEIPGLAGRRAERARPVARAPPGSTRRMPVRQTPLASEGPEKDFADEQVIHHEEAIRSLGEELDKLLDAPLLGPAKVGIAWDAGFSTIEEFHAASFEELATLPGFGRPVAARLFTKFGRDVPPPPPRPRLALTVAPVEAELPPLPAAEPPVRVVEPPLPATAPIVPAEPILPTVAEASPTGPEPPGLATPPATAPVVPTPSVVPPIVPAPPPRAPPPPPPPFEPAYVPEAERVAAPPPPTEPPVPSPVGLEVELSQALVPALQPFLDATAAGRRGLAIVREFPDRVRILVGPRPVAVYWLSNLGRDRTVRPSDLPALVALLRQGLEANAITAVFLAGIEYLTRIHGSDAVVTFLKDLDRLAREHEARVWLHLTPGLLSPADMERFVGALGIAAPPSEPDADAPPPPEPDAGAPPPSEPDAGAPPPA